MNYNVALQMDFIKNNLLLIAVAFASGAMLLWPFVRRTAGGPWVSTLQATQMINREDALVLDVREPAEFAKGHILGAKNVPLGGLRAPRSRARQAQGEAGDRHLRKRQPRHAGDRGAEDARLCARVQPEWRLRRVAAGRPAGGKVAWRGW